MLKVTARAKVNWTLDILGLLENGYHRMDMLASSVSLADELYLKPNDSLTLTVEGNLGIPADDNLVLRAANALREKTGHQGGAEITLQKHIPHGAGLGGGSADAAAALVGLNRLWRLGLPLETLHGLAQNLGADVPFFLTGGFARLGGFGEEIAPLPPLESIPLVILQPCGPQPSIEVFKMYDSLETVSHPDINAALDALSSVDFTALSRAAGNVLQQALEPRTPQITEALAALDACGAAFAMMTGSGSAVFSAFQDETAAGSAQYVLHKRWKKCWISHTDTQSITTEEV
ncbi:MAG: 4-(cytidine 5'-diphospho)-2-C-methyl-D-erythritol kinase [Clostridiales bacterium]|nr:4-(cytidine 5'-diphospho)-2-C-methyl-D-erythritol kinase [Clostridiales bacterium]